MSDELDMQSTTTKDIMTLGDGEVVLSETQDVEVDDMYVQNVIETPKDMVTSGSTNDTKGETHYDKGPIVVLKDTRTDYGDI